MTFFRGKKSSLLKGISQIVLGFVALSNFGLMSPSYGSTVAKHGAKCSKLGQIQTTGGKKFTCTKSGSKLIWNKGVPVSSPKGSPSQVVAPTLLPTPIPSSEPSRDEFECTNKPILTAVSNLFVQWERSTLVFNFEWDKKANDNWCAREFVIYYTSDTVQIRSAVDQFLISGDDFKRRIELSESLNIRTFNVFTTKFTSICVKVRTRFWVESAATCAAGPKM